MNCQISYSLNGKSLGIAFEDCKFVGNVYAAIAVRGEEKIRLILHILEVIKYKSKTCTGYDNN